MLTNLICMHTLEEKQTLIFLIHAHFAVTTVLSNVLSDHFFQQNKLTITFNKMITSGKSDYSSTLPFANCQNELHAKALLVLRLANLW